MEEEREKKKGKVLIVEDDSILQEVVKARLENAGYEVTAAGDGFEGVKKFTEECPDIVLMDIWMPHIDGIAAIKEIKRRDPRAQIIAITAFGPQFKVKEALEAGAVDSLHKPFPEGEPVKTIEKYIRI